MATDAASPVRLERDGPVATIVLDRPPVNALDRTAMRALIAAVRALENDDTLRVGILTGAGRCFCAGVDLKAQLDALEHDAPGPMDLGVELYDTLLNGRKPLIAAVNGAALGAGVGLSASCSILVAAQGAEFGLREIDVGALGGARHAMRLLGHSTVNRMLLTGHRLPAEELARRGAIEACLPADELLPWARALAREIASKDPTAIALARQCLSAIETMPVLEGYAYESRVARRLAETDGARSLMRAFATRGRRSA